MREKVLMNFILGYFTCNYPFLFIAASILFLMASGRSKMETELNKKILGILACLFALSVATHFDAAFQAMGVYDIRRKLCAITGYILRPTIILMLAEITLKSTKIRHFLWGVNAVNAIIMISSLWTKNVFYYEDNVFHRGPLGYTVYVVFALFYLFFLASAVLFRNVKKVEETAAVIFVSIGASIGSLIEQLSPLSRNQWLVICFTIAVLVYYSSLHVNILKLDPLTGVMNRQYYEVFKTKRNQKVHTVFSIDLNNLKTINDNNGHEAGDLAIKTVASAFLSVLEKGEEIFRIGGDEFIIFSDCSNKAEIDRKIKMIKDMVGVSGYSCAIGYASRENNENIDDLIRRSDENMYIDKKNFKSLS